MHVHILTVEAAEAGSVHIAKVPVPALLSQSMGGWAWYLRSAVM